MKEGTITKHPFVNKKGVKSDSIFELYYTTDGKEYFIKLCEGTVTKEELLKYLDTDVSAKIEFASGNLDICPEDENKIRESRGGAYVRIFSITPIKNDSVELHISLKKLTVKERNEVAAQLKNDGARVLFQEFPEGAEYPMIGIMLSQKLLADLFQGKMKRTMQPSSSSDKMIERWTLEKYVIPGKYKEKILKLAVPDPQQY